VNIFCLKVLIVTSLAVLLSIGPALADRFECYPSSQTGGGDTRRIVINIEFSRVGEVSDFRVVHQLGSGGARDRTVQYDGFDWEGTREITWTGRRVNDIGDTVRAEGTFNYRTRNYSEVLTVRGKGVVARIRSTCNRF
jgi:hypothetical protein